MQDLVITRSSHSRKVRNVKRLGPAETLERRKTCSTRFAGGRPHAQQGHYAVAVFVRDRGGGILLPVDASDPAQVLLADLGCSGLVRPAADALELWASSGGMALTGLHAGPPLVRTGPAVALESALRALQALAPDAEFPDSRLLGERAALSKLSRQGAVSCGGATRLLPCTDGWVAVALARQEDRDLVPALVEHETPDAWKAVCSWLSGVTGEDARARGRLLGLPLTMLGEVTADFPWVTSLKRTGRSVRGRPRVVDLSSLWAGPLCASLLGALGCEVVKVEDPRRPDGARGGPPEFFVLLNAGARPVALDLQTERGRAELRQLVLSADVVIEGSRPRALAQLGISAEEMVAQADVTWVSITAHGRNQGDRVGYGDDAAVAGGLVAWVGGKPVFVADAVADPLAGVHAALAAWVGVLHGGARLIDVALSRVSAWADGLEVPGAIPIVRDGRWWVPTQGRLIEVRSPWARTAAGSEESP